MFRCIWLLCYILEIVKVKMNTLSAAWWICSLYVLWRYRLYYILTLRSAEGTKARYIWIEAAVCMRITSEWKLENKNIFICFCSFWNSVICLVWLQLAIWGRIGNHKSVCLLALKTLWRCTLGASKVGMENVIFIHDGYQQCLCLYTVHYNARIVCVFRRDKRSVCTISNGKLPINANVAKRLK